MRESRKTHSGDDERPFIVLFGGVEAGYLIVKGQNWVPGNVSINSH